MDQPKRPLVDEVEDKLNQNGQKPVRGGLSRRAFLGHLGAAGVVATTGPLARGAQTETVEKEEKAAVSGAVAVTLSVNGKDHKLMLEPRVTLLDALRDHMQMFGTKKGCDHGQCGACTVHVDGRRVASCLTLAAKINGKEVLTIEGVSSGDNLHPMQQAFIDHDALQCGYCTPGQIMAAIACVKEGHATSREQIREYMSGNICRCGAYVGIVAAVEDAVVKMGRN
jgi:xanthine dehydrogenase YagT iron-sulfur-binding subunit